MWHPTARVSEVASGQPPTRAELPCPHTERNAGAWLLDGEQVLKVSLRRRSQNPWGLRSGCGPLGRDAGQVLGGGSLPGWGDTAPRSTTFPPCAAPAGSRSPLGSPLPHVHACVICVHLCRVEPQPGLAVGPPTPLSIPLWPRPPLLHSPCPPPPTLKAWPPGAGAAPGPWGCPPGHLTLPAASLTESKCLMPCPLSERGSG